MELISKIFTFWIIDKKWRKWARARIKTLICGWKVFRDAKSVGKSFYCAGFSTVNKNTNIGNNVAFQSLKINGGGNVKFGNFIQIGSECLIITQNHNYEGEKIPYDSTYIYKDIEIGDCVWIGSRVTILPGTKIGEGAIIQGGAVVHGEIPPCAIAGGNPAKVFKWRNIEHFKKLKERGSFLKNYKE